MRQTLVNRNPGPCLALAVRLDCSHLSAESVQDPRAVMRAGALSPFRFIENKIKVHDARWHHHCFHDLMTPDHENNGLLEILILIVAPVSG